MAGNVTPAPSNDIDWLDYMDYQNWSELPETGLDFMQGAEAGLGGADSPTGISPHRVGVNFDSILNSAALDSTLGIGLDTRNEQETCACITCLGVGDHTSEFRANLISREQKLMCRVPGCHRTKKIWYGSGGYSAALQQHEREHFGLPEREHFGLPARGSLAQGPPWQYACAKSDCRYSTKKFGDLLRHTTSKHCTNPNAKKWPCPEIGCKYGGSNGFTRKDKLKSHRETCHAGKAMPGKPYRVIKPAPGGK